jgi:hypothetical protein
MSTRVQHHRIVSATLQHTHFDNFTTLTLTALDADGTPLVVELFTDHDTLSPQWLPPVLLQNTAKEPA